MCILAWNWQPDQAVPLLVLSNRDEFYARPAAAAHWWIDHPILAGRDLQGGGTWLGVSRSGRFAALTNYREPQVDTSVRPSRGVLVADFLHGTMDATAYLQALLKHIDVFQPFNLLLYDGRQLLGLESRHRHIFPVSPGIGAVSNADFDTPWPKVLRLKDSLKRRLDYPAENIRSWLPLLQDKALAPFELLPDTGIEKMREHALSAIFIAQADYGTRASSVLQFSRKSVTFLEQSYNEPDREHALYFSFELPSGSY